MRVSWPLHPSLELRRSAHGYVASREGEAVVQIAIAAATDADD